MMTDVQVQFDSHTKRFIAQAIEREESRQDEGMDEQELTACPMCSGYAEKIGTLGGWAYYRCRFCGWEFAE